MTTITVTIPTASAARYATVAELKSRSNITDATDDTVLASVLDAVSRQIDEHCSRRFYKNSVDETRYYTAESPYLLFVDDLVSVTTLYTDGDGDRTYESTWDTDDYDLEPVNASLTSKPYTTIEVAPRGLYTFPVDIRRGVKVVGVFGWPSVPNPIKEACLLQSERLFLRKNAPFGVVGNAEMGQMQVIPQLDPDVKMLLKPFVKAAIGGV